MRFILDSEKANENLTEQQQIAVLLHRHYCHDSHREWCSWMYENFGEEHDWNGEKHKEYLAYAQNLLDKGYTASQLKDLFEKDEDVRKASGIRYVDELDN